MGQKKGTKPGNEGRKAWPLLPALPIPPIIRPHCWPITHAQQSPRIQTQVPGLTYGKKGAPALRCSPS